jgi:hypothetical protein
VTWALVWVAGAVGPLVPGLDLSFGHLPYGPFVVNGAFLVITVYAAFYVILEPVAGVRRHLHPLPLAPHTSTLPGVRLLVAVPAGPVRPGLHGHSLRPDGGQPPHHRPRHPRGVLDPPG